MIKKYKMKRVIVLNHHHLINPRTQQIVKTLKEKKYKVYILHWVRKKGDIYNKNSEEDSIILRVPNNFILSLICLPIAYVKFSLKSFKLSFDVIHCTHLILLPLAVLWKYIRNVKVVYDAHEFYLFETFDKLPRRLKSIGNIFKFFEKILLKNTDGILTVDSDKNFLERKYRKYNKNTAVIYNVPLKYSLSQEKIENLQSKYKSKKIVLYVGGISIAKGSLKILEVAHIVKEKIPDIFFMLIGIFYDNQVIFWQKVREYKLEQNVEFIPWLSYEEMLYYISISKVGLALYQPIQKFYMLGKGNSRKIFTYMQFGLPVIAPKLGSIGKVVKEENCGILVDTTNAREVAEMIIDLINTPKKVPELGERGRKAIKEKYNWDIEKRKVISVYEKLDN